MHADREPEEAVDLAHPLGVAARQVVVHGDDVDAAARRARSGSAAASATKVLPSPVFISAILPSWSTIAAEQLHVEVPLAERALHGLAHRREGLGEQRVERLARWRGAAGTRRSSRAAPRPRARRAAGSSWLMRSTSGTMRFSSRSFLVPTSRRMRFIIGAGISRPGGRGRNLREGLGAGNAGRRYSSNWIRTPFAPPVIARPVCLPRSSSTTPLVLRSQIGVVLPCSPAVAPMLAWL